MIRKILEFLVVLSMIFALSPASFADQRIRVKNCSEKIKFCTLKETKHLWKSRSVYRKVKLSRGEEDGISAKVTNSGKILISANENQNGGCPLDAFKKLNKFDEITICKTKGGDSGITSFFFGIQSCDLCSS